MAFGIVIKTSQQLESEASMVQRTPSASSCGTSSELGNDGGSDHALSTQATYPDSGYSTANNSRHASPNRGLDSSTSDLDTSITALSLADSALTSPPESPANSRSASSELDADAEFRMSGALHDNEAHDEEAPPSTPQLFGDTILHDGYGTLRTATPTLPGFCGCIGDCSCIAQPRPRAFQTVPLAKNQVGTQFLFSPEGCVFFAIKAGEEAPIAGVWVTQTIQVFGTRAQLRRAGMVPAHQNSHFVRATDVVEGLFVYGRGYTFPPELDLAIAFQEERTDGFVAVTINLNDKMPEDEEICLPWEMIETGTVTNWKGSATLTPWTKY